MTGTIVDDGRTLPGGGTADDDRPGFSINDLIIDESAGTVTFTVTRTGDLTQAASVDYAPQNGTATNAADFALTGGTLTFAPNMATQTITVTINNDGTYEGPEGFVINLSNPVGAVITDGQGAGTIVDNGTGVPPGGGTSDDDRPTISVGSDFTVDEAAGTITFTVTKTGSTSLPATVSFTTQDGSAVAGSDYSPASGTLTFAAGETTKQVTVSITNDAIYEGAQDFNLVISNPVNAKLGDDIQKVTIKDDGTGVPPGGGTPDDDRPVFTIGNDLIIDEKAGTATFTVTKTGSTTLTSTVNFGTSDAGATAGQDYTTNNGMLTFGANETTKTITIQIANDTTYEVSEGFKVTLSAPTNGVLGTVKEVTGTIVDDGRTLPGGGTADDDRPGFSINDLIIDESAGTVTFTVTRTGDLTQAASVDYAPQNGTATNAADFALTGGTLTFAPNMATQTITVTINNDGTYEGPEGFVINLSNPVGAVITDGQGAGTIVDDGRTLPGGGTSDDDRPTISVGSDFTVDEAAGTITFTVTKTGSTSLPATVSFTTQDGSAVAGSDYSPASGTLTFAAGETTKQVTVSITNDAIYEGAQDFNLVISNPVNAKLGDDIQKVTIKDDGTGVPPGGGTPDDDRPVFTIGNDLIIDEKAGTATFTVTKTGSTTLTSTVNFGTSDAGATAGQDYTTNNGMLTFGANETTKTITIQIANDTTYEVSEGFKVTLSAPTNGVLGTVKEVTGTIVDDGRTLPGGGTADDDRPGFSINDLIIDESAGTVTFTVTRTGDLTQAASVDYAPQNGTATNAADFALTGGTLTFAPNMATQTITVTINNDGTYEGPEGFVINLSNPVGAVITDGQGAGTIVDDGRTLPGGGTSDDDRPTISVGSDFTVDEAAGTITFTVTKTGSTSLPATVSFTTQDGSAVAGSDYSPASGTLTFAAGETTKQVTVSITNDAIYEGAQDFNLVISNPVNAKLGDDIQKVTIKDDGTGVPPGGGTPDDDRPVFTIGNDLIIDEKAGTATFTVTKTGSTTLTSTVNFGTSDAGATAGQDYTTNNGMLTFGANETTKTITIQIANDTTYEVSEGFKVTLSAPTNGVLGTVKEVTGTIVDDGRTLPGGGTADDDRPGFSINDLIIDESAGTVTFTVTRTGDLTQAASVDYAPQNGTATNAADFALTGGTLTFAPNMATQTITVTINNDGTYEGPEGFVINLSNPVGAVITDGQGAGTIVDDGRTLPGGGTSDDDRPTISVGSDFTVDEAAGTITFTVTKTGSTSLPATVSFTTQDGSAVAGSDYSPASGTLTFAAGETTKQVTVSITNDAIYEGAQDFNLVISNPSMRSWVTTSRK